MRPYAAVSREQILRQATLVNDLVADFERKLDRCANEPRGRENAGKVKSTKQHSNLFMDLVYSADVEYVPGNE